MPPPSAAAQLTAFLAKFTPDIAARAKAVLVAMRTRVPGATELVYDNYNALAIGFGPSDRAGEAVFSIAVYPKWVSLFFLQGAGLADPVDRTAARRLIIKSVSAKQRPRRPAEA